MKMKKKKILSIMVLALFFLFWLFFFRTKEKSAETVYKRTDILMGTNFQGTLYGGSEESLPKLVTELRQLETEKLSWREEESEIGKLNANGGAQNSIEISKELWGYVKDTLAIAKKSNGALDPTVGTITRLWDFGGENECIPVEEEIQEALRNTGYEKIQQKENTILLPEGMSLDLGAVGKGIAIDKAAEFIGRQDGVEGAVVAVGGSVALIGAKPDDSPFFLAITDPRGEAGEMLGILTLSKECFVSTSGDYEKYFMAEGKRYHHILNPKTGYPAESDLISVTVVCDSGLKSDGLSTACFVLGRKKGMELLGEYNAEGIFVDSKKNVYITEGLESLFTLEATDYKIVE